LVSGGNLGTARRELGSAGTQTAGLGFGGTTGSNTAVTEEYNGTSWTGGGNLNTTRSQVAGCGIQTNALGFGGTTGSNSAATEQYDGTTWSSSTSMSTARKELAGAGATAQAGLAFGGNNPYTCISRNRRIQLNNLFPSHGCLGERREFKYGKNLFSRLWNTKCSFSFWRICCTKNTNRRI
jgi:hypothetical protein